MAFFNAKSIFLILIIAFVGLYSTAIAIQCWNGVGDKAVKVNCPSSLAQGMKCGSAICKNSYAGKEVMTKACAPSNFCDLQKSLCESAGQGNLEACDTCYGDLCNGATKGGQFIMITTLMAIFALISIFGMQSILI